MLETKTANQLYKESNSSLPFADWIQREKDKGTYMKNELLKDVYPDLQEPVDESLSNTDLGIPKWVIITGIVVIVSAIIFKKIKK